MHLPLAPDSRDANGRAQALAQARQGPEARTRLDGALEQMTAALAAAKAADPAAAFACLDEGYALLQSYLDHLSSEAKLRVSCASGCSACCTDIPPAMAVEGLRALRALRQSSDAQPRIQRSVAYARRFQTMLVARAKNPGQVDIASEEYRRTQLQWRALGLPCPALEDDGRCGIYEARPLACRVHVHVQDPGRCEPSHPQFLENERPPLWAHPREAEFERLLLAISNALGLPKTPNLPWALAALHGHPLALDPMT